MTVPQYAVRVRKYVEYEGPVDAESAAEARKLVERLVDDGDTKFMFGTYVGDDWEYCVVGVSHPTTEYMDGLVDDCEVVNSDGTHGWR